MADPAVTLQGGLDPQALPDLPIGTGPASLARIPDSNADRFLAEVIRFETAEVDPGDLRPVVLCLGSSSFRLWDAQSALPDFKVYNFGFGGSQFSDVNALWPELACPVTPRYVLIYEGDNDIAGGKSAWQVFEDFLETMGRVQSTYPEADVVIVPVKPSPSREQFWPEAASLNRAMAGYAAERSNVRIVEGIEAGLLDGRGSPIPSLFADRLHLNEAGYTIWNERIRAALEE